MSSPPGIGGTASGTLLDHRREGQGAPPDEVGLQFDAVNFPFPPGFAQDFCADAPAGMDFGPPYGYLPLSVILVPVQDGNIQIRVK